MSKHEKNDTNRPSFSFQAAKTKNQLAKEHPELHQYKDKHLPDFTEALYEVTQLPNDHHDHNHPHHTHKNHHDHHTDSRRSSVDHHKVEDSKRPSDDHRKPDVSKRPSVDHHKADKRSLSAQPESPHKLGKGHGHKPSASAVHNSEESDTAIEIPELPSGFDPLTQSVKIFMDLKKIPHFAEFLDNNMMDFMKNLDLAYAISQNRELGKKIIADPQFWTKMIVDKQKRNEVKPRNSVEIQHHSQPSNTSEAAHSHHQHPSMPHGHNEPQTPTAAHNNHHHSQVPPTTHHQISEKHHHDPSTHQHHVSQSHADHHEHDDHHGHHTHLQRMDTNAPIHQIHDNEDIPSSTVSEGEDSKSVYMKSTAASSRVSISDRPTAYPFDGYDKIASTTPSALKEMSRLSYLFLHRHIEPDDKFLVCGNVLNYYDIINVGGKKLYRVLEGPETYCNPLLCPAFSIIIAEIDGDGDPVDEDLVKVEKLFHFFTAKRYIKVFCPPGFLIGKIKQRWTSAQQATFILVDILGQELIEISVSKYPLNRDKASEFKLRMISSKEVIGAIHGKYATLPSSKSMGEYHYEVKFPKELNCHVKLLIMTTWILIFPLIPAQYKLYFDKTLREELKEYIHQFSKEKAAS